ncbi:hypothetical protein HKCCE3408_14775 [Rhodobacterales bacterium HKCCE3408]|nr:hypothetical protein [Rhodobacterales bacterium HKCCE3408]
MPSPSRPREDRREGALETGAQGFACYVINLDGSTERFAGISARLDAAGLDYERQPAVDGRGFDMARVPGYDADAARRYMGRALVGGEIGCYLSHLETAERFLASNAAACLVLEDDAAPPADLRAIVARTCEVLDARDPDWRIVNLGNPRLKIVRPVEEIAGDGRHVELVRAYYFPMTTSAILWSRRGAADFVAGHDRIFAPVDNYLRHWITRVGGGYAFRPSPVPTIDAVSDIAHAAAPRAHAGRTLAYGWRKQRRLWVDKAIAALNRQFAPRP